MIALVVALALGAGFVGGKSHERRKRIPVAKSIIASVPREVSILWVDKIEPLAPPAPKPTVNLDASKANPETVRRVKRVLKKNKKK